MPCAFAAQARAVGGKSGRSPHVAALHKYTARPTDRDSGGHWAHETEVSNNRARSRRYLKPIFGCLRRNRGRVFAAALTRYLKPVCAAEPADIGTSPVARYSDPDHGKRRGNWRESGWFRCCLRPGTCACNHGTPGRRWQAVPARRAAGGPSAGSGAAVTPLQHTGTATESNEAGIRTRGWRLGWDAPAETCLRRRNVRLPGIICRRLQITAVMSGSVSTNYPHSRPRISG